MKHTLFILTLFFSLVCGINTLHASSLEDAENVGNKLTQQLKNFEQTIDSGDIVAINDQYDEFSSSIKKVEKAIGKVSGKSRRENLNNKYVRPSKVARERVIYEVSQYRLITKIGALIVEGNAKQAERELGKLERLKKRAIDIKKAGGYKALPENLTEELTKMETEITKSNDQEPTEDSNTEDKDIYFLLQKFNPDLRWGMSVDEVKAVMSDYTINYENSYEAIYGSGTKKEEYVVSYSGEKLKEVYGEGFDFIKFVWIHNKLYDIELQGTFFSVDYVGDAQNDYKFNSLLESLKMKLGNPNELQEDLLWAGSHIPVYDKGAVWHNGQLPQGPNVEVISISVITDNYDYEWAEMKYINHMSINLHTSQNLVW